MSSIEVKVMQEIDMYRLILTSRDAVIDNAIFSKEPKYESLIYYFNKLYEKYGVKGVHIDIQSDMPSSFWKEYALLKGKYKRNNGCFP